MADYWIKWYQEILDDPKMATLPDRLWRRFSELCLLTGRLFPDKSGKLPDTRQIAWALRMNTDDLQIDLAQLVASGLIEPIPNGWIVVNFEKRQSATTSTERVKQHRERKKRQQYYADETNLKRNVAQSRTEQNRADTPPEEIPGEEGSPLTDAFVKASNILPYDLEKWVDADQTMTRAGVLPVDIDIAIKKMNQDGLTYSGLWSVIKTAIWVKSRRENAQPIFNEAPNGNGRILPAGV